MFDVSFSELFLILVVAVVAIGPKDLPMVIRHVTRWMRQLRGLMGEVRKGMDGLMQEARIQELHEDLKQQSKILDLEGKWQETYDISDLTTPTHTPVVPAEAGTHIADPQVDPALRRADGEER